MEVERSLFLVKVKMPLILILAARWKCVDSCGLWSLLSPRDKVLGTLWKGGWLRTINGLCVSEKENFLLQGTFSLSVDERCFRKEPIKFYYYSFGHFQTTSEHIQSARRASVRFQKR
jgi:hypothetical protein